MATLSALFPKEKLLALVGEANTKNLVYLAAGYYIGAHYSAQVAAYVVAFLTK